MCERVRCGCDRRLDEQADARTCSFALDSTEHRSRRRCRGDLQVRQRSLMIGGPDSRALPRRDRAAESVGRGLRSLRRRRRRSDRRFHESAIGRSRQCSQNWQPVLIPPGGPTRGRDKLAAFSASSLWFAMSIAPTRQAASALGGSVRQPPRHPAGRAAWRSRATRSHTARSHDPRRGSAPAAGGGTLHLASRSSGGGCTSEASRSVSSVGDEIVGRWCVATSASSTRSAARVLPCRPGAATPSAFDVRERLTLSSTTERHGSSRNIRRGKLPSGHRRPCYVIDVGSRRWERALSTGGLRALSCSTIGWGAA